MPGTNITRDEAAARASLVRVDRIEAELDLTTAADSPTFPVRTRVHFEAARPGEATWVDHVAPAVRRVVLNGEELDPAVAFDGFRISLPAVAEHNELVVESDAAYMRTGEGLHRFTDPVDKEVYLYSQFEVADARRVYACFDQPDLKAAFTFVVDAPAHWTVLSNSPTPEPEPLPLGNARWRFDATARISTYITAIVAGPYHGVHSEYAGPHGTYPFGVYCRRSLAEHLDADDILLITEQGFAFFEEAFGTPYPFAKYDQVFVPEFNAGAMENAGCVTFLEDLVFRSRVTDAAYEARANTILHELAHMWFGDLVTMTWWDDLWLNESFAEWAAHHANVEATRFTDTWTSFLNQRKAWAYRQDQLPSTHPIAADMVDLEAVEVNFDGITYAKGAAALRQLVAWVGEEEFFAGLRTYFAEHAWGNTSLPDLLGHLERSSGRDLSGWARDWLQTSGVNLLRPEIVLADDGSYASVGVRQLPPSDPAGVAPVLRSHRIGVGCYELVDGGLALTERHELDVVGELTDVPALAGRRPPALLLLNDGDLTFAKVRLDEASLTTAVSSVGLLDDPLARALVWGAAWDMTRDAEMSAGDFLTLVISGLDAEGDVGVLSQLVRQARSTCDLYAAPEHREAYLVRLGDALMARARTAPPGSDRQLVFVRGATAVARTPQQRAFVAALLDGSEVLDGLAVDADLRWALLHRLVVVGDADVDRIDDELERDDTATGRRHATSCRAAVPDTAAKQAAWASAVDSDALPNSLLTATVEGFVQPDQRELQRPFVPAYFETIERTWAERTNETAQTIVIGLYPLLLVEQATVDLTDAWLAEHPDAPAGARRLVLENRDGVARAMRCQARDRG